MAIDMSKVKGKSSTEYGESLLSELSASNARIRKSNAKNAKRETWANIGANVGIGLINNYQENEQAKFLALEQNASKILQTKNVYGNANLATEEEKNAQNYETGYSSYFTDMGEKTVKQALTAKYANQGVYSQVQLNGLVKAGGYELGKKLEQAHKDRYKHAQDYLATTGEDGMSAYVNVLKKQKPTDLKGLVNNFVGSITGLSGNDALNARAKEIFDSSEKFKTYQDTYNKTKNADLSVIFAEELPEKLNAAKLIHGKTIVKLGKSPEGIEEFGHLVTDPTAQRSWIGNLTRGSVTTVTDHKQREAFSAVVANLETASPSYVVRGQNIAGSISPDLQKQLTETYDNQATEAGIETYSSDPERIKYHASKNKLIQNQAGAMAIQLTRAFPDMGTDQIDSITKGMLSTHIKNPNLNLMSKGAGMSNPVFTLLAISEAVGSGEMKENINATGRLLGDNGINLFTSYKNAPKNEKIAMQSALQTLHERTTNPETGESTGFNVIQQLILKAEELQLTKPEVYPTDESAYTAARNMFGERNLQAQVESAQQQKKTQLNDVFKALDVVASINNDPSITRRKTSKVYKANIAIIENMTEEQKNQFEEEKNKRVKYLQDIIPKVSYTRRASYRKQLTQLQENYGDLVNQYYKKD
tara:strand:+ start:2391 stop:4328 length:1938 start_codon:yes stop_codon:yes gene_type:complete